MAATSNPFNPPVGSRTNAFAPSTQSPLNPFAPKTSQAQPASANPFAALPSQPSAPNPFSSGKRQRSSSPSAKDSGVKSRKVKNPFAVDDEDPKPAHSALSALRNGTGAGEYVQPSSSQPPAATGAPFSSPRNGAQPNGELAVSSWGQKHPKTAGKTHDFASGQVKTASPQTAMATEEFAKRIHAQLAKDRINPPEWPINPGSRTQKAAMSKFREDYKAYRDKARTSLVRAELIDDPDKQKRLEEAIAFKGICEEMCPEWEKITRITELDVKAAEKEDYQGELVAEPQIMVKRLARSAAGQEAPMPMDVRSSNALRRTLDYLIEELLNCDARLPSQHNFIWDRTRAIRRDFTFQAPAMGPEEIKDHVYCLETITRLHVTALHLLSREGFAAEDFSEQQEIEQLGNTLLSLVHQYDDCAKDGIECENEAEFRAYYALFRAQDPTMKETVQGWDARFWNSDGVRTAMCLVESIENSSSLHGPLAPYAPTEIALQAASMFFSIVSSPQVSYTMACFAEIHFNRVRRGILQTLKKAYSRPRHGPKDITPAYLQQRLHFDEESEAIQFAELHGLDFEEDMGVKHLALSARQQLDEPRIPHSFSEGLVERKRGQASLPDVIFRTVYDTGRSMPAEHASGDSLFVDESVEATSNLAPTLPLEDDSASTTSMKAPAFTPSVFSNEASTAAPPTVATPQISVLSTPSIFGAPASSQTPSSNMFGSLAGASNLVAAKSQSTVTEAPKSIISSNPLTSSLNGEKKVTFGENTYIDPPPTSTSSNNTTPSPFGFLKDTQTTSQTAAPASSGAFLFQPRPASTTNKGASQISFQPGTSPGLASDSSFLFPSPSSTASPTVSIPGVMPTPEPATSDPEPKKLPATVTPGSFFSPPPALGFNSQKPLFQATNSEPAEQGSNPAALGISVPSPSVVAATTSKASPPRDSIADLTRWFVCADNGLLQENLEGWILEPLLKDTWMNFCAHAEEKKRKEEDEKSWADARKFRTNSLMVTYFYRWLENFRRRRVVKRLKMEKEKFRQWNSPQSKAQREAEERAVKERKDEEILDVVRRRARRKREEEKRLRQSVASREKDIEDALLATGIFSGLHDEQAAARQAARDGNDASITDGTPPPSHKTLLRLQNQRREKHGMEPLHRLPEPTVYKDGTKSAKLKALKGARDGASISTSSFRDSTFSSSLGSSVGLGSSRVTKPRKSRVSDHYWNMKAKGLVQMPNGEYLHESLALPLYQDGRRFSRGSDFAPRASGMGKSQSPSFSAGGGSPSMRFDQTGRSRVSSSPSAASNTAAFKRKLAHVDLDDEQVEDEDLATYRSERSASVRKRPRSGERDSIASDQDFLSRLDGLLQETQKELALGKKG